MSRPRGRTALVLLATFGTVASAQPERPLPLDPLTAQERALTDTIVRADGRVREFLAGGASRQIGVSFIALKEARDADTRTDVPSLRTAEALFYRYDIDQGLQVLVDIERRAVIEVARVPGASVPINRDEVAQAARLALADRRVVRLFGERMPAFRVGSRPASLAEINQPRIEGLRTVSAVEGDPCYRRRCIGLFFRVNNRYVHTNRVVVDLVSQRVFIREGEQ